MSEKSKIAEREEQILKFWEENKIFEKSVKLREGKQEFVFYEGPPTANGMPGIHHLEARSFKDIIPRYKTMRGFHARRKGGWDTHGLPVELQVEKKLGLKSKKEIEKYGIAEFNKKCKESVWEYLDAWNKFTERIGYWVDQEAPYVTYDNEYIESVWNILKKINDRGLLYKDYKVVPWCPRCGTALSSHELAQGYEVVKDISVYTKFRLTSMEDTYLLAWTTTPWTLPGNVALAVGEDIDYVEVKLGGENLILAKERLSILEGEYKIEKEFKGSELIGLEYEPLFDIPKIRSLDKENKAYRVYPADFVNTLEGTGIVHTAVMYGEDDFILGTEIGLPKFHLVNEDGTFREDAGALSGKFVRDEETAVDIIRYLANKELLFKKEKYEHSYPHCWRCKTPLIYYARDSWYIRMSELRGELVKENSEINWEPEHIRDGRFGEWLKEAKDWAVSRERYWGTPLPLWQNDSGKTYAVGSIEELKKMVLKSGNKYFTMRHGESEKNADEILNHDIENVYHLTHNGVEMIKKEVGNLKYKNIDLIISSPFDRCKETAEIVAETLELPKESIIIDDKLWELKKGSFYEGKTWDEYQNFFKSVEERFDKAPEGGETYNELKKRAGDILYELESKYKNRNILIISHKATLTALHLAGNSLTREECIKAKSIDSYAHKVAEVKELDFVPMPHNESYELDLHKPYIDEIKILDENKETLARTKEVIDVWFDSGAMPFAQDHYPFENREWVDGPGYPADYISEAVDQTRGWFYTLHAIGVLMKRSKAYKNVICLGHILDAKGKKMSKSLGNIVDPWLMADKYGVDALRLWMYSVNQPGDSKNFDEQTVDEMVKKVLNPLENVLSFYKLYSVGGRDSKNLSESENILDKWIISRLNDLVTKGERNLDNYKVFEAARLIREFANDFSTWYVRRSRDRFKSENIEDREAAIQTTRFILLELAKYMAPFAPFFAEYLYKELRNEDDKESVHLADWPEAGEVDEEVLENMRKTRGIVSLGLERRNNSGIKVRQPLSSLKIKNQDLKGKDEYLELIKDEINVKQIDFDENLSEEVELDTQITEELKREGEVRELIRSIQELRKEKELTPDQKVVLMINTNDAGRKFVEENENEIKKPTNISEFSFADVSGKEIEISGAKLKLQLGEK